jgi:hypothetical protein
MSSSIARFLLNNSSSSSDIYDIEQFLDNDDIKNLILLAAMKEMSMTQNEAPMLDGWPPLHSLQSSFGE